MAKKILHERVFQVDGIGKNVQPIEKRPSRSFSATTLRRHPAQKVVPPQTDLKEEYFYNVDEKTGRKMITPLRDQFGVGPLFWRGVGTK